MISPYRRSENRNGLNIPQMTSNETSSVIESAERITYNKVKVKVVLPRRILELKELISMNNFFHLTQEIYLK